MTSALYLRPYRFCFTTVSLRTEHTARHGVWLLYSLSGRPLEVRDAGGSITRGTAIAVAPAVPAALDATDCHLVAIHTASMSYEYRGLKRMLGALPIMQLAPEPFAALGQRLRWLYEGSLGCGEAFRLASELVRSLPGYAPAKFDIDARVLYVTERLVSELPPDHTASELAESVGLSADRLRHLFREQVGIPLRNHLLGAKLRRAAQLFASGQSLTEVAHQSGFSDSSHLSRTFKSYYGFTPSFLADSRNVQVHSC